MTIKGKNYPSVTEGPNGSCGEIGTVFAGRSLKQSLFHRNLFRRLGDESEGAEEDGVGCGFAEFEFVAGIEPGGAAGLHLDADARGPVYHHGAVG